MQHKVSSSEQVKAGSASVPPAMDVASPKALHEASFPGCTWERNYLRSCASGTVEDTESCRSSKDGFEQTMIQSRNGIAVASALPSATWERDKPGRRGPQNRRFGAILLALFFLFSAVAIAEEPSVSATLSSAVATVGDPVELNLAISGASRATVPQDIHVDGLAFQGIQQSQRTEIINFKVTSSLVCTYTVVPQRPGTFTIPALQIDIGGKTFSTQPLTLTVTGQAQTAQPSGPQGTDTGTSKIAFAEWVLPKTSAYLGEAIPAELRLYVDAQVRWNIQQMPAVAGDGFVIQKLPQPKQTTVTKNGRAFDLLVFRTAVTPVKAGKLTLPATEFNTQAVLPQSRSRRPNMPQMPGFPNMFNDPAFDSFFATPQQVTIRTEPVDLEIKPLPVTGKPKSFSGAVGQFVLQTKASPLSIHAGDPITVTAEVSGIGNFDRMGGPRLADEPGWRAYPPSSKFKADDDVGISGSKTFEFAAIPDGPKENLPAIEFSFFDPSKEQYVTLTGDRIPISVEGSATPSPTPALAGGTTAPSNVAAATPPPKANDILYIQPDTGDWGATFEPAWRTRTFWLAQLAPLAALLAFGGWQLRQNRLNDLRARRIASLRAAKAEATRTLQQDAMPPGEFYDAAVRIVQLETALNPAALKTGREPATVDAETACAGRILDADTASDIRRLFAAHDELRYAGNGSQGDVISPERRESVLKILERFEKSHEL